MIKENVLRAVHVQILWYSALHTRLKVTECLVPAQLTVMLHLVDFLQDWDGLNTIPSETGRTHLAHHHGLHVMGMQWKFCSFSTKGLCHKFGRFFSNKQSTTWRMLQLNVVIAFTACAYNSKVKFPSVNFLRSPMNWSLTFLQSLNECYRYFTQQHYHRSQWSIRMLLIFCSSVYLWLDTNLYFLAQMHHHQDRRKHRTWLIRMTLKQELWDTDGISEWHKPAMSQSVTVMHSFIVSILSQVKPSK